MKCVTRAGAMIVLVSILNACQTSSPQPGTTTPLTTMSRDKPPPAKQGITPEAARNFANNCFACHGPNGRSPGSIPSLTNLSAYTIARKLRQFKDDDAFSTVMGRLAKGYSDVEIEAVANYIAGLKK